MSEALADSIANAALPYIVAFAVSGILVFWAFNYGRGRVMSMGVFLMSVGALLFALGAFIQFRPHDQPRSEEENAPTAAGPSELEESGKIDAWVTVQNTERQLKELESISTDKERAWNTLHKMFTRAGGLLLRPIEDANWEGHVTTASESWTVVVRKFEKFHLEVFKEEISIIDDKKINRFLHLAAPDEPDGLNQELQDSYRRHHTMKRDLEVAIGAAARKLNSDLSKAKSVLGVQR